MKKKHIKYLSIGLVCFLIYTLWPLVILHNATEVDLIYKNTPFSEMDTSVEMQNARQIIQKGLRLTFTHKLVQTRALLHEHLDIGNVEHYNTGDYVLIIKSPYGAISVTGRVGTSVKLSFLLSLDSNTTDMLYHLRD